MRKFFHTAVKSSARLAAVTAAMLSVGCADPALAAATPAGLPAGFPDISGYEEVDAFDYSPEGSKTVYYVDFVTPDGIACSMKGGASCNGADLPGLPDSIRSPEQSCVNYRVFVTPQEEGKFAKELPPFITCDPEHAAADRLTLLPPFHKIVRHSENLNLVAACGVDDQGVTACYAGTSQDGPRHGFVISPERSWTF